jgi:hypothetical protein
MRVFGFDLLPYPEHLDHLKVDGELPYPLPGKYFRPELAVQNVHEPDPPLCRRGPARAPAVQRHQDGGCLGAGGGRPRGR